MSPDKQFYHCFGCGAHGTVVGFLMQYEKLGFLDAVADLAQRAGLELPREAQVQQDSGSADLHEVMARASRFFEQNLADNPRGREYLAGRGIDAPTSARFALGYAPDAWNALLNRFGAPGRRAPPSAAGRFDHSSGTPAAANEPPASTTGSAIGSCFRSATRGGACWLSAAG